MLGSLIAAGASVYSRFAYRQRLCVWLLPEAMWKPSSVLSRLARPLTQEPRTAQHPCTWRPQKAKLTWYDCSSRRARISLESELSGTPLALAAERGHTEVVKRLLEAINGH